MIFSLLSAARSAMAYAAVAFGVAAFVSIALGTWLPTMKTIVIPSAILAAEYLVLHEIFTRWRRAALWRQLVVDGRLEEESSPVRILESVLPTLGSAELAILSEFESRYRNASQAGRGVDIDPDDLLIYSIQQLRHTLSETPGSSSARTQAELLFSRIPPDLVHFYFEVSSNLFSEARRTERGLA